MSRNSWLGAAALIAAVAANAGNAGAQTNVAAYSPCRDAWVTSAFMDVTGSVVNETTRRKPAGYGDTGECNVRLYGNGSWSSYNDLVSKVRASINGRMQGVCRDSYVTSAVRQVKTQMGIRNSGIGDTFAPQGFGERGECNMYLYGGGSWSSMDDLKSKVTTVFTGWRNKGMGFDINGNFVRAGLNPFPTTRIMVIAKDLLNQAIAAGVVAGGAGNIVATDGATVVAAGAGN